MWRLIAIVLAIAAGLYYWMNQGAEGSLDISSPNGFAAVIMPDGAPANTVMIFAPKNCPSDAAQRALDLSVELDNAGVPNQLLDHLSINMNDSTEDQRRTLKGMEKMLNNGEIPHVFVNGMAKSNPSADEVKAEYYRTKG